MATNSTANTTTTQMDSGVPDFSISVEQLDEGNGDAEFYHYNEDWNENYSYFVNMPEVYQTVVSLNMWAFGKGYLADTRTRVILEHLEGWGKETFDDIIRSLGEVADVQGDAYAEIIRDEDTGTLINLKKLNPYRVRHVIDKSGLLKRYDYWENGEWKKIKLNKMFHVCSGRVASNTHGTSKIKASKWLLDAKKEAMEDWRRISHRSTIRVLYVDVDNTAEINRIRTAYKEGIRLGEVLVLPIKKGDAEFEDLQAPPVVQFLSWIQYIDSAIQKALGVPDAIMGGTQIVGEANSKIGYLTFEVPYSSKANKMERDLWNQLQIEIEFEKPKSLMDVGEEADNSNAGQMTFQPNDMGVSVGRTE